MAVNILPCFKCRKPLEPAVRDSYHNQPYAGTRFSTRGHYGSTVFDNDWPAPRGRTLEVNICDECLTEHKDLVYFVTTTQRSPEVTYAPWEPEVGEQDE